MRLRYNAYHRHYILSYFCRPRTRKKNFHSCLFFCEYERVFFMACLSWLFSLSTYYSSPAYPKLTSLKFEVSEGNHHSWVHLTHYLIRLRASLVSPTPFSPASYVNSLFSSCSSFHYVHFSPSPSFPALPNPLLF